MIKYLIRKIFYGVLVLFGVVSIIFFLFNILPGDPARMMLGQRADINSIETIRKDLGLDKPVGMQYLKYLDDLSPISFHSLNKDDYFYLDKSKYSPFQQLLKFGEKKTLILKFPYLRRSYQSKKTVSKIIAETLPNTFILAFIAILFASIVGIFFGIISAIKKDSLFDRATLFFSALGMSLPSFFAAILIGWFFAFVLGKYTGLNLTGNLYVVDDFGNGEHLMLRNLILPAITLGIRPLAVFTQLSRNSLLEVLSQDYIRTAFAKGLSFYKVITRHALKNSLNPLITTISGWFASLMAGVVFVEYIFGWKGLGYVIVDALNKYDLPLILGCILTISITFVVINILVDIVYTLLDPRVKLN